MPISFTLIPETDGENSFCAENKPDRERERERERETYLLSRVFQQSNRTLPHTLE
jgi:hypothetical protein